MQSSPATVALAVAASVLLATPACSRPTPPAAARALAPRAAGPVDTDPLVGAVFPGGTDLHTCTGSVLHSGAGDLILTAAHCLGGGYDATFVPGFNGTSGPAGTWKIDAVYMDQRWVAKQDPLADYAIARVSRDGAGPVEALVGTGLSLGTSPLAGTAVTITAYTLGAGGGPIGCSGTTAVAAGGFPSLQCAGFVDGTSGAPWRSGSALVGVIGGVHGGGCPNESVSYSPPFNDAVTQLLGRAEAGGPADTPPQSFNDDCVRS
jgi:hypothetical protein